MNIVKSIHLAFAVSLAFLLFPGRKKDWDRIPIYDLIFAIIGAYVALYIAINYMDLIHRAAIGFTTMDYFISALGIIFVMKPPEGGVVLSCSPDNPHLHAY
ncbi:MAG: hypothetical protein ACOC5L_04110 [Halobacteriota archaeon]